MKQKVKNFWKERAKRLSNNRKKNWQATSLTSSELLAEKRRDNELKFLSEAISLIPNTKNKSLLDIGCGVGRLTIPLSSSFSEVYAIDYIKEFIDEAKKEARRQQVKNINFFVREDFDPSWDIDCCLICGVLLCLDEKSYKRILKSIKDMEFIILKESVGVKKTLRLIDHHSQELKTNYNALYRSESKIIKDFLALGYKLVLNKLTEEHRKETNIRIFVFEKECKHE
jgi:SAM-dependent methyltransferase